MRRSVLHYLFLLLLLSGCSGRALTVPATNPTLAPPAEGLAQVVFVPPSVITIAFSNALSLFGPATRMSVVDTTDPQSMKWIGFVPPQAIVVDQVPAGERIYMVVGESSDFIRVHLEAGKTYFALLKPRMGIITARYSFEAVHKDQLTAKLLEEIKQVQVVRSTERADKWFERYRIKISRKQAKNWPRWLNKPTSEQPTLVAEDGTDQI